MKSNWRIWGYVFFFLIGFSWKSQAEEGTNHPVLIISSYNPETYQTSRNISDFLEEYKILGGTSSVIIENMNCKSFSEAPLWKPRMKDILDKYTGSQQPGVIILLGQEAWASYLMQNRDSLARIPVVCGMASRNVIALPEDTTDLENWEPESKDALRDHKVSVSGFLYEYDVRKNIELILSLYPDTRHIAFISDNSYGGVTLQAYVKQEMSHFPEQELILLDGRKHTIYTIVDRISHLPEHTVILVGTWRVDKNEGYFMRNATYSMMSANPNMPAFSISSVGLGHWVLGGYIPEYRDIGKDLAKEVILLTQQTGMSGINKSLHFIPNAYEFDMAKLKEFDISLKKLPANAVLLNKEISFWFKYSYELTFIGIIFVCLLGVLGIILNSYLRTKKLKDELEESEVELVAAKEKAEESDRLKSAFLANMSHEIRTPLNAIVGFSNVLVSDEFSPEEQRKFVEIIQTNSDLLLRLINDILDISRLETGRLKLTYEKCDLVALCESVLSTTACSKKEGVSYIFEPGIKPCELETDVQRLQQILINLLSNANKFTESGEITLSYTKDEEKQCIVFSISDTGCGIPVDKQNLVFERFAKLNEYVQGTGLGLAICKITVNMLGGEIWVDRNYSQGARFMFTHPLKAPRSSASFQ